MSSQEAVDFCQNLLQQSKKRGEETYSIVTGRKSMAKLLVAEALRRGSMDNISIVVIWLAEM